MSREACPAPSEPDLDALVRALLADVLGLETAQVDGFTADSELFGALPEFDSMAVANVLTALEERLGVMIEDDEVEAEDFASFGALCAFAGRLAAR